MAGQSGQAIDGERQARERRIRAVAAQRQRALTWAEEQQPYIVAAANPHGVTNPLAQWGVPKTVKALGTTMLDLNPQLRITPSPREPDYYGVWLGAQYLFPFGPARGGIIPEYSVMESREIELPHVVGHMDRETPATLHDKSLGQEQIRGWRTILVRLVQAGATTPELVERAVGAAPRASWAALLKKRTDAPLIF